MRIAVLGVGGAGGYFGAKLAHAGEEIVLVARGEHLQAIRSEGLSVETPAGEILVHPALATDAPAEVGPVDVVLLGVKAEQVADAAKAMAPMIGPDTCVVPLQNGVEAPAQLAQALGPEHALGGLCGTISWVTAPGRIRTATDTDFIKFGELDNRPSERTEELRRAFDRAGVTADIPEDVHKALWEKFLFVVSFGGVGAVTRAPIGVIRALPEVRQILEGCMQEIFSVARARRIALDQDVVDNTLSFVDSLPAGGTTSLQRDIADGKPSELEAWNGAVVRLGEEAEVETPLHKFIHDSLLPLEMRARGRLEFPAG